VPQLHLYVPDAVAKQLRAKASALGMSMSRYLATVVCRGTGQGWPEGFFDEVVGKWKGKPLRRPPQGTFEERDSL
jgi:hypothetical protein